MRIILMSFVVIMSALFSNARHTVNATKYYAGHKCGMVTADGSRINVNKVHTFEHRWVALSRDLFKKGYKLGDRIFVTSDNKLLHGIWIVKDKMGPGKTNSIDFLMTKGNSKGFGGRCKVKIRKIESGNKKKRK